jgi:hypothetical protein
MMKSKMLGIQGSPLKIWQHIHKPCKKQKGTEFIRCLDHKETYYVRPEAQDNKKMTVAPA